MKKIGIFDSGLGGLLIAKAIKKYLPEYDYVYLGDTKRVPYGNRSHEAVYKFTLEAVKYLFEKENCGLVVIACNTASARALRRIQGVCTSPQPSPYKGEGGMRKVLGVLIPAAEEGAQYSRVGVLATHGTVASNTFVNEIHKIWGIDPAKKSEARVFQSSAPMLVPLVEEGEDKLATPFIKKYLKPLLDKKVEAIVLGCTHYPILKNQIKKEIQKYKTEVGLPFVKIISQDEIIPKKLKDYLARHPEISKNLSQKKTTKILVTDLTQNVEKLSQKWFGLPASKAGKNVKPKLVQI